MESIEDRQTAIPSAPVPLKFRKAGLRDIYLLRALAEVCFRHTYRKILKAEQTEWMMRMMYSHRSLRSQITGGHTFYILYLSANPCGYISIEQTGESDFCFQKIYLLPDFQGRGLGRKLIEKGMEHVCSFPCPCGRITLHVNRHNKARDFYLKMGFRILEEGDFDIGGGFFMNDYIMVKDFVTGGMEL